MLARLLADSAPGISNMSLEQRRLWMLLKLDPSKPWQMLSAARIAGKLDVAALQQALTALVERHGILRTVFLEVNGEPLATTLPAVALRMPVIDINGADQDHRDEIAQLALREARVPFDVSAGPLVRSTLVRCGEHEHVLLVTMHQLIADRRSLRLFVAAVLDTYSEILVGQEHDETGGAADFGTLVTAQRSWLMSDEAAADAEYWRDQMAGVPPLELPADRPRPAMKTIRCGTVDLDVPGTAAAAWKAFSDSSGHKLPTLLLAGYVAILRRYARQHDICVGVSAPATWYPDAAGLIGPLDNTVPLRFNEPGDPSLEQLVPSVARVLAAAQAHGRLPFDQIVEAAGAKRDLSRTPLYQAFFTFEATPADVSLPGAQVQPIELEAGWTEYDVDLSARWAGDGLALRARYNADLLEPVRVRGLLRHVVRLLTAAVADPSRPLSEFPLLDDEEREQVLVTWNATARDYPGNRCLHHLIEEQAARSGEAIAVWCGGQQLSYQQLNDRANALAARLVDLGAVPETRIGVVTERGVDPVTGLLGVLKAGAAYVPLDPAYPADRLRFILADAGIHVIVGSAAGLRSLPAAGDGVIRLEIPSGDASHRRLIPVPRSRRPTSLISFTLPGPPAGPRRSRLSTGKSCTPPPRGSPARSRGCQSGTSCSLRSRSTHPRAAFTGR